MGLALADKSYTGYCHLAWTVESTISPYAGLWVWGMPVQVLAQPVALVLSLFGAYHLVKLGLGHLLGKKKAPKAKGKENAHVKAWTYVWGKAN